jgi:hypothetical protein
VRTDSTVLPQRPWKYAMAAYAELIASSVFAALPVRSLCTLCALCEIFILSKSQAKKTPSLWLGAEKRTF